MSFRRDGETSHNWTKWVETHRPALLNCGIPSFLLESEHRWLCYVEEGYDEETRWLPSMLTRSQASSLHAFILREYGDVAYRGCLREIEEYLER